MKRPTWVKFVNSDNISNKGAHYTIGTMTDEHGYYFFNFKDLHSHGKINTRFILLAAVFGSKFVILEPQTEVEEGCPKAQKIMQIAYGLKKQLAKTIKVTAIIDISTDEGLKQFKEATGISTAQPTEKQIEKQRQQNKMGNVYLAKVFSRLAVEDNTQNYPHRLNNPWIEKANNVIAIIDAIPNKIIIDQL